MTPISSTYPHSVSPIVSPTDSGLRARLEAWGKNRPNLGAKSPTPTEAPRLTRGYEFRQSLLVWPVTHWATVSSLAVT
jgi:hypothetical protein